MSHGGHASCSHVPVSVRTQSDVEEFGIVLGSMVVLFLQTRAFVRPLPRHAA